jgi:predicted AAA+ superfamily ATPase
VDLVFIVAESREALLPQLTPRRIAVPDLPNKAAVLIGMRRSGKTYLMYQEMQRLLAGGVDRRDILYVNFEDDRLQPAEPGLLSDLLEAYYRAHPAPRERRAYLFLDEIQVVPGWPRFVRRILDTEQVRVVLGGSSAKLLHTEVATELRGRGFAVEVFPYDLTEALASSGEPAAQVAMPGAGSRSRLEAGCKRYLEIGGFPEVQAMELAARLQTLQDYVELVLLRDVIERHRVENVAAARAFARLLLQSPARAFSVNKTYADLRSRGLSVSRDTLHALLDHFQDAYLVFAIPVFKKSLRARTTNARKLYAIDPGLAAAMSHVTATDAGARLENAVFLELRRRRGRLLQGQVSYYLTASGHEVDFVVGDVFEQRAGRLVQSCASLADPVTREREVRALTEAMGETGLQLGEIVTLLDEETIKTETGIIHAVPAWRWLRATDE